MNKFKTKKALAKRVKISKSGKWIRKSAFTSHLAQNKTTKQKRHARKGDQFDATDIKRLKHLINI